MTSENTKQKSRTIIADARELQAKDSFQAAGWTKVIAPAKVNLYLAVDTEIVEGRHQLSTVFHALNLHDVVYLRKQRETSLDGPVTHLVSTGDVLLPEISSSDNLASKAVSALGAATQQNLDDLALEIRIEKNIPFQAGLGGASADAAAALLGAAKIWGIDQDDSIIEQTAKTIGSDVAFFLHGGCAYLEGAGDTFVRSLEPSKQPVALIKPNCGVSTKEAYEAFDRHPVIAPEDIQKEIQKATKADEIPLFNSFEPVADMLVPELQEIRLWLEEQPQCSQALLSGSGAATFALCPDFPSTCALVAAAKRKGWWARATSLSSVRAAIVGGR